MSRQPVQSPIEPGTPRQSVVPATILEVTTTRRIIKVYDDGTFHDGQGLRHLPFGWMAAYHRLARHEDTDGASQYEAMASLILEVL